MFLAAAAGAQRYGSYNYFGRLYGKSGVRGYQFETIHGIHLQKNYVGVGAGMDGYGIESVPVFANITHHFFQSRSLFASLNAGTSLVLSNNLLPFQSHERNQPALCYEPSVGYLLKLGKKGGGLVFNAGYSFKEIRIRAMSAELNPQPLNGPAFDTYRYRYNRIAMRIGFVF